MNGLIRIGDIIATALIILLVSILFYCAVVDINTKREEGSISVPHNYHIIYDDNNKVLIVPDEYHFHCDEKGSLTLTK